MIPPPRDQWERFLDLVQGMGMGITGDEEDKCAISFLGGMASILAFSAKVPKHLINEEINEFIHQLREVMLEDSKIDIFEDMP